MEEKKKGNEQLDKIDGGAICEFRIQACFPKVLAVKDTGNLPISSGCSLREMDYSSHGCGGRHKCQDIVVTDPAPGLPECEVSKNACLCQGQEAWKK